MDILSDIIKYKKFELFEFSDAIKNIKYNVTYKYLTCEHSFEVTNFSINQSNSYVYICYKCGYATKYLV